jgi:tetrahydromethanopterin S-methyltransferase subunit G
MSAKDHREDLREQPIGDLVKQLSSEVTTLVHQEMDLAKALLQQEVESTKRSLRADVEVAKAELQEKGKHAGRGAGMLGGAGIAAILALGTFTVLLLLILNAVMKDWLAAIIVTLLWSVVAAVLAARGRAELKQVGAPIPTDAFQSLRTDAQNSAERIKDTAAESAESIKEDIQWAKTQK